MANKSSIIYIGGMSTLSPSITVNQLVVVRAANRGALALLDDAAGLALAGPLRVLDGGNCINIYPLARALRRRTAALTEALHNVRLSRAFTCYQMLALLSETPADGVPTLVLDLLGTFYDESVPLYETQRLLRLTILELLRLRSGGPLTVSARPPNQLAANRQPLYETLLSVAEVLR
jgi:hypothetical protein